MAQPLVECPSHLTVPARCIDAVFLKHDPEKLIPVSRLCETLAQVRRCACSHVGKAMLPGMTIRRQSHPPEPGRTRHTVSGSSNAGKVSVSRERHSPAEKSQSQPCFEQKIDTTLD